MIREQVKQEFDLKVLEGNSWVGKNVYKRVEKLVESIKDPYQRRTIS